MDSLSVGPVVTIQHVVNSVSTVSHSLTGSLSCWVSYEHKLCFFFFFFFFSFPFCPARCSKDHVITGTMFGLDLGKYSDSVIMLTNLHVDSPPVTSE